MAAASGFPVYRKEGDTSVWTFDRLDTTLILDPKAQQYIFSHRYSDAQCLRGHMPTTPENAARIMAAFEAIYKHPDVSAAGILGPLFVLEMFDPMILDMMDIDDQMS